MGRVTGEGVRLRLLRPLAIASLALALALALAQEGGEGARCWRAGRGGKA